MTFCVPQNVWSLCEACSKRISIAATILFPSLVVEILKMLLKIFIDFSPHYKLSLSMGGENWEFLLAVFRFFLLSFIYATELLCVGRF